VEPSIWRKFIRVWEVGGDGRIEIGASLHDKCTVGNRSVFWNANRREPVGAATVGERSVLERHADVEGNAGIEAECFVHCVLLAIVNFTVPVRQNKRSGRQRGKENKVRTCRYFIFFKSS
jgi:hypothetical protein